MTSQKQNDVPLLDRTFGFETAVDEAREAINVANTEAEGFPHGLGVVSSRELSLLLLVDINFTHRFPYR